MTEILHGQGSLRSSWERSVTAGDTFSRHDRDGLTVGLDDLRGLFQL